MASGVQGQSPWPSEFKGRALGRRRQTNSKTAFPNAEHMTAPLDLCRHIVVVYNTQSARSSLIGNPVTVGSGPAAVSRRTVSFPCAPLAFAGKAEKKTGKPEDLLCSRLEDGPSATGPLLNGTPGINSLLLRLPLNGCEGVFLYPLPQSTNRPVFRCPALAYAFASRPDAPSRLSTHSQTREPPFRS